MLTVVLLIAAACVVTICATASRKQQRTGAVVGYSGLFWLGAQITWTLVLFLGFVPIDEIFRSLGMFSDVALQWYPVIALVPPVIATVLFAMVFWRRTHSS